MSDNQLLETWQIHDRINLYLLDAVDPAITRQSFRFERPKRW